MLLNQATVGGNHLLFYLTFLHKLLGLRSLNSDLQLNRLLKSRDFLKNKQFSTSILGVQ